MEQVGRVNLEKETLSARIRLATLPSAGLNTLYSILDGLRDIDAAIQKEEGLKGAAWGLTSWKTGKSRTFDVTAALLNAEGKEVARGTARLVNGLAVDGGIRPANAYGEAVFANISVNAMPEDPVVGIIRINNIPPAAGSGYMSVYPRAFNDAAYSHGGYNWQGFDKDGYNRLGYDKDGFDRNGFNEEGYDRDGYDKEGYNKEGYDESGYDIRGYNKNKEKMTITSVGATNRQKIAAFTRAIKANPNDAEAYSSRGNAYQAKKDYDNAIADYTQAIKINPNDYFAYAHRALAYEAKDDYDNAIADYTQMIELDPKYYLPTFAQKPTSLQYISRGGAYFKKGDYDNAIADYTQLIKINPNDDDAYFLRGLIYAAKGDYDNAIADYTRAIKINPNDSQLYNKRSEAYKAKGDMKKAEADYKMYEKLKR